MDKRQQLEERINRVTARIADRERELRVAGEAVKELVRLRLELRALTEEYTSLSNINPGWRGKFEMMQIIGRG